MVGEGGGGVEVGGGEGRGKLRTFSPLANRREILGGFATLFVTFTIEYIA